MTATRGRRPVLAGRVTKTPWMSSDPPSEALWARSLLQTMLPLDESRPNTFPFAVPTTTSFLNPN